MLHHGYHFALCRISGAAIIWKSSKWFAHSEAANQKIHVNCSSQQLASCILSCLAQLPVPHCQSHDSLPSPDVWLRSCGGLGPIAPSGDKHKAAYAACPKRPSQGHQSCSRSLRWWLLTQQLCAIKSWFSNMWPEFSEEGDGKTLMLEGIKTRPSYK